MRPARTKTERKQKATTAALQIPCSSLSSWSLLVKLSPSPSQLLAGVALLMLGMSFALLLRPCVMRARA
jgi:hypothetical protein